MLLCPTNYWVWHKRIVTLAATQRHTNGVLSWHSLTLLDHLGSQWLGAPLIFHSTRSACSSLFHERFSFNTNCMLVLAEDHLLHSCYSDTVLVTQISSLTAPTPALGAHGLHWLCLSTALGCHSHSRSTHITHSHLLISHWAIDSPSLVTTYFSLDSFHYTHSHHYSLTQDSRTLSSLPTAHPNGPSATLKRYLITLKVYMQELLLRKAHQREAIAAMDEWAEEESVRES